jgi:hypothetical protein
MNKEFIPYEQALALKELGFNEPCFAMYQKNKKIWFCGKNNWITNFEIEPDDNTLKLHIEKYPHNVSLIGGEYFLQSCANFTTPLYQQAFRWFREKHGLSSYVRLINLQGKSYWKIDKVETEDKIKGYSSFENSYEGSELECLKKLIELITIKNNE